MGGVALDRYCGGIGHFFPSLTTTGDPRGKNRLSRGFRYVIPPGPWGKKSSMRGITSVLYNPSGAVQSFLSLFFQTLDCFGQP